MKILIAYYSKSGNTEKLANALREELERKKHQVEMEKIKPAREKNLLGWFFLRLFRGECQIVPPKVKDVSDYDLICLGSPNWTRVSLPLARYIKEIEGLKYKRVALFATTALPPQIEWYILSAYLFDYTLTQIVQGKGGKIIDSILLSSLFGRWSYLSEYGKKKIENFCKKIETPIISFESFFLEQKEADSLRLSVVLFSSFLFFSLVYQTAAPFLKIQIFTWQEYLYLFIIGFLAYFTILTMLAGKVGFAWGKYLASLTLTSVFTILILFLIPDFGRPIISGYVLIFILISFFRSPKAVLFTGLLAFFGYLFLFLNYPQKETFSPFLDSAILIVSLGVIGFITHSLQKSQLALLEAQDETETARAVLEIKVAARTRELRELSRGLEEKVGERTKELRDKMGEMEKFNKLAIGRELKMIELKKEIRRLEEKDKKKR